MLLEAFVKGLRVLFKAFLRDSPYPFQGFLKGIPFTFSSLLKGFLSFLSKASSRDSYSCVKGFFKGSLCFYKRIPFHELNGIPS